MVPASSVKVPRVSTYSGSRCSTLPFAYGAFTLFGWLSQYHSARLRFFSAVRNPGTHALRFGLFRRYLRNRFFFLFLALLRCFSSGGSPPHAMDSRTDAWSLSMRVSPFRHPRIIGYLHLPAAFRSLSRLSSALSAKASSLCSFMLDLRCIALHLFLLSKACFGFFTESFDSASDVLIFEISFYIFFSV